MESTKPMRKPFKRMLFYGLYEDSVTFHILACVSRACFGVRTRRAQKVRNTQHLLQDSLRKLFFLDGLPGNKIILTLLFINNPAYSCSFIYQFLKTTF